MTTDPLQPLHEHGFETELIDETGQGQVYSVLREQKRYRLRYCGGTRWIEPWIELDPDEDLSHDDPIDRRLVGCCHSTLETGSHIMVQYTDTITAEALTIDIPPAATPIGYLLFTQGFTWFKDWYIAEGWREGGQKLQANISDDESNRKAIRSEIEAYLDDPYGPDRCQDLAEQLRDQF